MTVTIELPHELERRLETEAARRGLSKQDFVRVAVEEKLTPEKVRQAAPRPAVPRVLARNRPVTDRSRENQWLARHGDEYAGQWVALAGSRLLAHGFDLPQVAAAARAAGVNAALIVRAEPGDAPLYAGM